MQVPEQLDYAIHVSNLVADGGILLFLLKINKSWTRLKDRVDQLYKTFCTEKGIDFVPIDK